MHDVDNALLDAIMGYPPTTYHPERRVGFDNEVQRGQTELNRLHGVKWWWGRSRSQARYQARHILNSSQWLMLYLGG